MMGDTENALKYLELAIPLVRYRDEAVEVLQLKNLSSAQLEAQRLLTKK